ncbi:MAG TPA: hypothetical protein VF997_15390, partial [Polyangia bacterium]
MRVRGRRLLVALVGLVGLWLVAFVAASLLIDSYAHRHEREVIGQLEERLGRKVAIGKWSVSLWSGLNAQNVSIGGSAAPGDAAPLVTVERVHARPRLLRTLASLGRHAQLGDLELVRPTVTVVRFADGSFNLDRVAEHWQKSAPAAQPAQPMSARTRRLVENARIGSARIQDGHIRFVDA